MNDKEVPGRSITEQDIKKLTLRQLVRTLSVGAWIWILVFIAGLFKLGYELGYRSAVSQFSSSKQEITLEQLNHDQISLVREIWKYQKLNDLEKVIITGDGFIFDEVEKEKTTINLAGKVLGNRGDQYRFEMLILSIPVYFLEQIPETEPNNAYVVTVPAEARRMLDKR